MSEIKIPLIFPSGWKVFKLGGGYESLSKVTISGLSAIFTIDFLTEDCKDLPPMGSGEYLHISLSRQDKYPEWDEMRDFIYKECPWFDDKRDIVMLLPPKKQYVNVHKNCFHFYQKIEP